MAKSVGAQVIQWTGENWREVYDFSRGGERNLARVYGPHPDDSVNIDTADGMRRVAKGDLIVRLSDGALAAGSIAAAIREDRAEMVSEARSDEALEDAAIQLEARAYDLKEMYEKFELADEVGDIAQELRVRLEAARKARAG